MTMRNFFIAMFALLVLCPLVGNTQIPQENERNMSQGTKPGFMISLDQMNTKESEKLWLEYLKDTKAKVKKDRKTNETVASGALIPTISASTANLYATFVERGARTEMTLWMDLGGSFLSSRQHPEKIDAFRQWMDEFQRRSKAYLVDVEVQAEEKKFNDLKKDYDQLLKEQDKLEREIRECETRINEARKTLEINNANQNSRRSDMERQQRVIEEVKQKKGRVN
jgi:hypothetical protein